MNPSNLQPAWPHRPPLGVTLSLAMTVALGAAFTWATVRSMTGIRRVLLPVYVRCAVKASLPMPTLGRQRVVMERFVFPDGSAVRLPVRLLYDQLRSQVYGGESVPALFRTALIGTAATFFILIVIGASWDRASLARLRNGRRIRGPRLVSRFRYNLETRGDGLRFQIPSKELVLARGKESHHLQIAGDTGSGKSTLIRSILYQVEDRDETAIVFDPDREYLKEFYNGVRGDIVLNPKDERCPYWAIGEEADDEAQATAIANGLFPDRPTEQEFFLTHTRAIFAYLLANYKPTVTELGHWMAHPEEIDRRVRNTEHEHTLTENAAPQRAGILGTLNKAGQPLRMMPSEPEGRRRFTVRDWARRRRGWIFVTSTPDTFDAVRPLQGLWLDMLILKLQGQEAEPDARRCWLVLDEVQELQKLPQLPKALTRQRKSGNPIVIGFQGMAQIDSSYGKQAETMLSQPFTNFILRTREPRAAEHLSNLIGKVQIERLRETRPAVAFQNRNRSYSTERVLEPLVLPSEIQGLKDLTGYFVQGDKVVAIAFERREVRTVAPGLIERMIPAVPTRPLHPERPAEVSVRS